MLKQSSVAAVTLALGFAGIGQSFAQQPIAGRVLPESFAPRSQRPAGPLDIGAFSGAPVPPNADRITFIPAGVEFSGDPSPLPFAADQLQDRMAEAARTKTKITLADFYGYVHDFERQLAGAGYILFRAVIPPQKIKPGQPIKVKLVDGYIDTIDVSALPPAIQGAVRARLEPLRGQRHVRRRDIEHALLLSGDFSGLTLRSTFAPGDEFGATKIIIDGSFKPVTGSIGADRLASDSVGGFELLSSLALNSVFGGGEQIYFAYQGDPETNARANARMRIAAVGATVPLGYSGLTVSPEFVWAQIRPTSQAGVPDTQNDLARGSVKLSYPLVRQIDRTVTVHTAVEAASQRLLATAFNVAISSDSYAVWRSGVDAQIATGVFPALSGTLKVSQGLGHIAPVFANTAGAPSTHVGAHAEFTKVNATLGTSVPLGEFTGSLGLRGQLSFSKPLFNSEQLSLDAFDGLSSLSPGRYAVDQGATARVELARPQPLAEALLIPYVFGGVGVGSIFNATALESPTLSAMSIGAGIRLRAFTNANRGQSVSFAIEYGHNWISSIEKIETDRINVAVIWNF